MFTITDVILVIVLAIASLTDFRTMTVPIPLFPAATVLWLVLVHDVTVMNIAGAVCCFVPLFIFSLAGKMGGADLIIFTCIGFILGAEDLVGYTVCLMVAGVFAFIIVRDGRKKIPIAPVAFAAYILHIFGRFFINV